MNPSGDQPGTPKEHAAKAIDEAISRYRSVEYRRTAVRKALASRPDDPRLLELVAQLTSPQQLRRSADAGIFINYVRSDEIFAIDLAHHLLDDGINVWLDMIAVAPDADWHNEVEVALESCGLMLAVLSPEALSSEETVQERARFQEMGKLVLPVICERCQVNEQDFWLTPVDFSLDFDVGLRHLRHLLLTEISHV